MYEQIFSSKYHAESALTTCTNLYETMAVKISWLATPLVYPARLVFQFQQYSRICVIVILQEANLS